MVKEGGEGLKSGCIKSSHGPWLVHKTTKDGGVVTKYRYPSEKERQNNKQRERKRRSISKKIFAGLRAYGNYQLPKHADSNDLLRALCDEAGWHVDEDGNVYKKVHSLFLNFHPTFSRLLILSRIPVSDARYLDTAMDTPTFILGPK